LITYLNGGTPSRSFQRHSRCADTLAEADWPAWLGEAPASGAELKALLRPYPPGALAIRPVDREVGDIRNDDSRLGEPVDLA
jgi:putative SOS response-associated peptidase YedK